jgi:hypothetical protein
MGSHKNHGRFRRPFLLWRNGSTSSKAKPPDAITAAKPTTSKSASSSTTIRNILSRGQPHGSRVPGACCIKSNAHTEPMPSDWNAESRKGEFVGSLRITVAVNPAGGGIVACHAMGVIRVIPEEPKNNTRPKRPGFFLYQLVIHYLRPQRKATSSYTCEPFPGYSLSRVFINSFAILELSMRMMLSWELP